MSRSATNAIVVTLVAAILYPANARPAGVPNAELLALSLPRFTLASGERVVKYDCKIKGATISELKIPLWDLTIDNGSGVEAEVSANIKVGAAAFTQSELRYFRRFIILSRPRQERQNMPEFHVSVELWISVNRDMTKFREVIFLDKDLVWSAASAKVD
jgi:hypothetical protein